MRQRVMVCMAAAMVSMAAPGAAVRAAGGDEVTVSVVATGLNDPRGLTFGSDGHLYVAEAGDGSGSLSTVGQCDQVQPPVGPFVGGASARVLEFSPNGYSVVAGELPSAHATALIGGDRQGVSAVTFAGNRLFALLS